MTHPAPLHRLLPLLLLAALPACGPTASEAITLRTGAPLLLPDEPDRVVIECEGSVTAEVEALGALCGFEGQAAWGSEVADMSLALGPEAGPYLIVLGFVPDRDFRFDQAGRVEYDVRLVDAPREGSTSDQLEQWSSGVSLAGEMTTQKAVTLACDSDTFIAGGKLRYGGVTITFGFRAGSPC